MILLHDVLVLLLLWATSCSSESLHPFSTKEPTWPHTEHKLKPSQFWGPDIKAPYPTNAWWQDVVLETGRNPVFNRPYSLTFHDNGPLVGMPRKYVAPNGHFISKWWHDGVTMGFTKPSTGHQVMDYDEMTLTVQYHFDKGSVTIPAARGGPYVTGMYAGVIPELKFISNDIVSVDGVVGGGSVTGTRITVRTVSTQVWLVYTTSTTTWLWDNKTMTASAPTTVRLVATPWVMPLEQSRPILDKYAACIPLSSTVAVDVDSSHSHVTVKWGYKSCPPLILALPHHQDVLSHLKHTFTRLRYDGILGSMIGVAAATWSWSQRLVDISYYALHPIAADKRPVIVEQIKKDLQFTGMAPDTYSFGKGACRIARLALIAEELKQPELVAQATQVLWNSFQPWVDGTGMDSILYDTTWYGTIPKRGLDDWHEDFGAGWYNDHHFHYGYWLYAAAVLAKNNKTWAEETKDKFVALARDIANPSPKDPWFPVYRHFDWYAGHSWASGLMAFTDGRNQESSSECLNGWYGLMLYGKAIGDRNLQRTGASLLAHEMRGAKKYWHSTSDSSVYPEGFSENKGVGMIWGDKVDYNTWFGAGVVYALGINMIPFTPLSEIYLDQKWMAEAHPVLAKGLAVGYTDDWAAVVHLAEAVIDPAKAWRKIEKLGHFDDGMSRSNAMWWIATRPTYNPHNPIVSHYDSKTGDEDDDLDSPSTTPGERTAHHGLRGAVLGLCLLAAGAIAAAAYSNVKPWRWRPGQEGRGLLEEVDPVPGYDGSRAIF
eukprot:EG_transcript_3416